jgi:hypothetical protein
MLQKGYQAGLDQLIHSLPRIKGLKRLAMNHGCFRYCIRKASFLPVLHQNTSLETFNGIQWYRLRAPVRFQIKSIFTRNCGLRRADFTLGSAADDSDGYAADCCQEWRMVHGICENDKRRRQ